MEEVTIGIDLGTTYCCMAAYVDGKVRIIPNDLGHTTTPSYISIDSSGDINVGKVAKEQACQNPSATVYGVKRLIGLPFHDPVVQQDISNFPFDVINEHGTPKIRIDGKSYHPEQISAKILARLKAIAEDFLGCPVKKAVITVPAYFNDQQRQATKAAGQIANLEVLRILNEPTAAAIAYCHQENPKSKQTNLIFDLGGGTFDVAVLTIENQNIKIIAVGGDTHLGGEDFDLAMVEHCIDQINTEYKINFRAALTSEDPSIKAQAQKNKRRLKVKCEEEKKDLTSSKNVTLSLDAFHTALDVRLKISRDKFNALNEKLFKKCVTIVDQVLKDGNIAKQDIDEVILVGGSSRIPRIQELIKEYFNGKSLSKYLSGDEAVAYGAAIQAALLNFNENLEARHSVGLNISIQDVVPLSIGIEASSASTEEFYFHKIIKRNTPVPCCVKKTFYTRYAGHKPDIVVRQGEDESWKNNAILGRFKTVNLPDCPANAPVYVSMQVTAEGILIVTASYEETYLTDDFVVDALKQRLTKEEIISLKLKELELKMSDS
ncbi:unnamed protein product [Allacma fusca]|uniref:Uncharacterized protein n=1 Tax=Allacma fusca TaxID=39272 RepID=A0A8J2KE66_9HEXA|nr:unnamed protein product [Allacma fusca]